MDNQKLIHDQNIELGRKVKVIRAMYGLSQDDLVARSGLSKHTIVSIETGRYNTGVRQLTAILDAMGYELVFQPKAVPTDRPLA